MSDNFKAIQDLEIMEKEAIRHRRETAAIFAHRDKKRGWDGMGSREVADIQRDLDALRAAIKEERRAAGLDSSGE